MTSPRVEVGRVRVIVDGRRGRVRRAMIVEDELVRREERVAVAAADTLSSRTSTACPHTARPTLFLMDITDLKQIA